MDFSEYSKQAIKTASCDKGVILDRLSHDSTFSAMHAALGMCSEAGEVYEWLDGPALQPDYELVAELGDCLWYANLLMSAYSIDGYYAIRQAAMQADCSCDWDSTFDSVRLGGEMMAVGAGKVCDLVKASIFYGRVIDYVSVLHAVEEYLSGIMLCCRALRVTLEEVMDKNIAKLRARYGDVFSAEKANVRDLHKEQVAYSEKL